jgi:hypothetical protein
MDQGSPSTLATMEAPRRWDTAESNKDMARLSRQGRFLLPCSDSAKLVHDCYSCLKDNPRLNRKLMVSRDAQLWSCISLCFTT